MTTARRFPVTEIQRAVQGCLSTAPRVVDELERITGFAASSIRICLARLEANQQAYRLRIGIKRGTGYYYLWHAGQAPKIDASAPQQQTIQSYEPHHVRDPLVVALFGPAGSKS